MPLEFVEADLSNPDHARDFLALMDHFALDPMGGGKPLDPEVRARLVPAILERSDVTVVIAYERGRPVGLANCIEGFSTFAARPIWNLHDMVVHTEARGRGVGLGLLAELDRRARERGYCKITLEVMPVNEAAQRVYRKAGFDGYSLGGELTGALFFQKVLAD